MRRRTSGGVEMRGTLQRLAQRFPQEVGRALYQETEIEKTEVHRRTPVDKSPLRASEHVEGPTWTGRTVRTAIVAGGPSAPYALIVHEDPDAIHPVGQWKFIESVLNESAPSIAERVRRRLDLRKLVQ